MDNAKVSDLIQPEIEVLKDQLKELVRYASLSRMKVHADCAGVDLKFLDCAFRPGKILANNMVFILVSGDALRLTLKVHFNTRTARNLAYKIFGVKSAAEISSKQAIDYFKEYGNLVAGSVISLLGENDIELGISLPLCTRGFYEVFSDYSEKQQPVIHTSDFWELDVNGQSVFCSAQYEILNLKLLDKLATYQITEVSSDEDGEMDFL